MQRWGAALPSALVLLALTAAAARAAGPPFPAPVDGRAVYDQAGVLRPEVVAELEERIDAIEGDVGAEIVVYMQVDSGITEDENLAKARALIDEWGIGRAGFDDGLVLLVGLDPDLVHGKVSLYGGSGFVAQHIDEDGLQSIVDGEFVPRARDGDLNTAALDTIEAVQERIAPETIKLTLGRVVNAALGLIGAPSALVLILGFAWRTWRREGDDPELIDSPSILMAGPPAEMTPPLATVVRNGTADQHSINTLLAELASTGRITFHNLDQVGLVKSDDPADPLTDPAIEINPVRDGDSLAKPEREAWATLRSLAGGAGPLSRERLWRVNSELDDVKRTLEKEAVRLGWLARMPGPDIAGMTVIGGLIIFVGGVVGVFGISIPMSGAVMLGAALILGGVGTIAFGRAMSQRTQAGAYVDAMLTAYRRTLRKTMDLARSMDEVVERPEIARLADTPDKAVVWGLALGLHEEVATVLARGLAMQQQAAGSPVGAYYPTWLGSSPGTAWAGASAADVPGGVSYGSGSLFSRSAIPDIGGMFHALGSVGSSPPSSSSSDGGGGGGFSGGGGGGGGGGSGSF